MFVARETNVAQGRSSVLHRYLRRLEKTSARVTVVLIAALAYVAIFVLRYTSSGLGAGALVALPVMLAAWLFGVRAGLFAAVAGTLLTTLLLNMAGVGGLNAILRTGGGPGTVALFIVALGTGWLGEMVRRHRAQSRELKRERALLQRQVANRERAEATLRRRDAVLEAVSFAATRFLETASWRQPLPEFLARLGAAANVSRVYVFENHLAADGELLTSQRHEWVAAGVAPQIDNPELQCFPFLAAGFGRWVEFLSRGEPIYGHVRAFPEAERALLASHDIYSIAVVPIFVGQHWWGHIGFDRCDAEQEWPAAKIDALRTAAGMLGATILRERAEAAQRASEQRLELFFSQSLDGFFFMMLDEPIRWGDDVDKDAALEYVFAHQRITKANDAMLALYGAGRDRLLGRTPNDLFAHNLAEGKAVWRRFFDAGHLHVESEERRVDGTPISIEGDYICLYDAEGRIAGHFGAQRDVTARKQAEASLRDSERRYRDLFAAAHRQSQELALLDQIRTALARELDLPAVFRVVVEAIAATFGYTQVSLYLLEGDVLRLQHQVGYDNAIDTIAVLDGVNGRVVRTGAPVLLEDVRDDPAFIGAMTGIVSEICAPLLDRGQVVGTLNIESVDGVVLGEADLRLLLAICLHVNIAIERARLYAHLRESERKLLEAQKLESLSVLAGGIAHDFNNLLMAILGNAELALLDVGTGASTRYSLDQIVSASKRAAELTTQMLAYAGKGRFVIQQLNLNMLVEEVAVRLSGSLAATTTLRLDLAPALPNMEGDHAQIRQVVTNLAVNAAEAIGDRVGTIRLTTGVRRATRELLAGAYLAPNLPEGYYVFLEVSDDGSGMDADTLSRAFDPFFTTKFMGRGLGLAAVLGIVRGHHGAIEVGSLPGQGTTFTALFPASDGVWGRQGDEAAGGASFTPSPHPAVAPALAAAQREAVLVVDDEAGVRAVAARMLERAGFQVLTASDGAAGVELFRDRAGIIGLVLLDLTMPLMNGEQTLRALRAIDPAVRVIMMSGYDERELTARFDGLQPAGFLQKPFTPQALSEKIQRALA